MSVCDLVISKRIDILSLTETWLSTNNNSDPTLAVILNTLQDFDFINLLALDLQEKVLELAVFW